MNWVARHRRLALAIICVGCTVIVLLTLTFPEVPFFSSVAQSEQSFQDVLRREGRKTATRADVAFLGIDENTLNFVPFDPADVANNRAFQLMTEHPSPWSRELWALLLDRLFQSGARLVMFDLLFNNPGDGDAEFRAALDRYRDKVVLGANFDQQSRVFVWPHPGLIEDPPHDQRVGYVVFFPDDLDGRLRSVRYFLSDRQLAGLPPHPSQQIFTSMSARVLEQIGRGDAVPRALEPQLIRFSALDAYQPKPLWEVFDPAMWAANYKSGAVFKDKIVLVGA
ncbi:MAG: CHASE2 domain-containing protein, partial [Verrucomicrobiota bacterium]|nr:CHASE2 domain-containing protein [Verrucomicrobiota bacterium]